MNYNNLPNIPKWIAKTSENKLINFLKQMKKINFHSVCICKWNYVITPFIRTCITLLVEDPFLVVQRVDAHSRGHHKYSAWKIHVLHKHKLATHKITCKRMTIFAVINVAFLFQMVSISYHLKFSTARLLLCRHRLCLFNMSTHPFGLLRHSFK